MCYPSLKKLKNDKELQMVLSVGEFTIIAANHTVDIYLLGQMLFQKCGNSAVNFGFLDFIYWEFKIFFAFFLNMLKYFCCVGSDFSHLIHEIVQQCPQLSGYSQCFLEEVKLQNHFPFVLADCSGKVTGLYKKRVARYSLL